jgi:hypothetical protein
MMLSAELAKRLERVGLLGDDCPYVYQCDEGFCEEECCAFPLSQLLEEVEKRDLSWELHGYPQDDGNWYWTAIYRESEDGIEDIEIYKTPLGKANEPDSPEDAVALALLEIVGGGRDDHAIA